MLKLPLNSVHPLSRAEWREWFHQHHTQTEGVWLITYKKATGKPRMEYDEAVEEALCFGWVDSRPNKLDATRSMLWFAPYKVGTGWSEAHKERIAKLIAMNRMMPTGLAIVEAAKRDGSWTALVNHDALEIPADLKAALEANPQAQYYFEAFPSSAKQVILEWLAAATKPETRTKRIAETMTLAAKNIRANQWKL